MNINWDEAVDDAESTPRNIISHWLEKAEDIDAAIVIVNRARDGKTFYTCSTESAAMTIGMLEIVKHRVIHELGEDEA